MNHSDWVTATGTSYVGLGGSFRRPLNPKLLPILVAKARPKKPTLTRDVRRTILRVWQASLDADRLLASTTPRRSREPARDPSIYAQSRPGPAGAAARMRHWRAVQSARR